MKLSNLTAHRLLTALRSIETDQTVKLSGQIRLDIARNINRLMPEMTAFEKATGAKRREIQNGPTFDAANRVILAELDAMNGGEIDVKLIRVEHGKLNLDDNPRITGDMIAGLAPILKDFDTVDSGE